jgi:prepilin-type processing-associated H-X9-DG protein
MLMGAVAVAALAALCIRVADDFSRAKREAANRAGCVGQLKAIIVGLHFYHATYDTFPPGTVPHPGLPPARRLGWPVSVHCHVGGGVDPGIDGTKGWDEPPNRTLTYTPPPGAWISWKPQDSFNVFVCSSAPDEQRTPRPTLLSYVGIAGLGPDAPVLPAGHPRAGVFGDSRATRMADIHDGTSVTMMLAESSIGLAPWTAGGPSSVRGVDPATRPYLGPGRAFGGYHPGGANVAMADGSVKFVRETIAPAVFEAMSTIAGGEPVPPDWD